MNLSVPILLLSSALLIGCTTTGETRPSEENPSEIPLPVTCVYKQVDDCEIKADVYQVSGNSQQPVILYIHGGALIFGSRTEILYNDSKRDQLKRYLNAGFTVVAIDYRLAPETKLPEIIEDLKDAYRWIREEASHRFKIDTDSIIVLGESAGGYLTLMSGFCVEPRPKALVSFYGYGDITGSWYSKPDPFYRETEELVSEEAARDSVGNVILSEAPWPSERLKFYLYCRQNGLWPREVSGFHPLNQDEEFDFYTPERNVTEQFPPTLLLHGNEDTDVPYELSERMSRLLSKAGVINKLITLEGRGHGFDFEFYNEPDVEAAIDSVLFFLTQHAR